MLWTKAENAPIFFDFFGMRKPPTFTGECHGWGMNTGTRKSRTQVFCRRICSGCRSARRANVSLLCLARSRFLRARQDTLPITKPTAFGGIWEFGLRRTALEAA